MTRFPKRSRRLWICAAVLVGALALGFGGPPLYRWMNARSAEKAAESLASNLGLHLSEADTILYTKYYSSFPDSSAYLVIESTSRARAEELRAEAGLTSCGPAVVHDFGRIPSEYRPVPSSNLTSCESPMTGQGFLRGVWNPAVDQGRRVYMWAIQM
ncbi:hypothetical protein B2J88_01940 [Rhodococcus sp. SRB_17]|nr:hypothetical protein [Rhodococcus sp. SRB_17]